MNGRDVPDLLTGLQHALNVAHEASEAAAAEDRQSNYFVKHHQSDFYPRSPVADDTSTDLAARRCGHASPINAMHNRTARLADLGYHCAWLLHWHEWVAWAEFATPNANISVAVRNIICSDLIRAQR
jgi:hypothetical protein